MCMCLCLCMCMYVYACVCICMPGPDVWLLLKIRLVAFELLTLCKKNPTCLLVKPQFIDSLLAKQILRLVGLDFHLFYRPDCGYIHVFWLEPLLFRINSDQLSCGWETEFVAPTGFLFCREYGCPWLLSSLLATGQIRYGMCKQT